MIVEAFEIVINLKQMSKKKIAVGYDIETISNFFSYSAMSIDRQRKKTFYVWGNINQIPDLVDHLQNEVSGMIGYNNLKFDYPVIHFIIQNRRFLSELSGDKVAKVIYKKAQEIIKEEYSAIREKEVLIPQLDLFAMWHYDNKARITSLKKLQIAMNYHNVQDMPIKHYETVDTIEQVNKIIDYNFNDVDSTLDFYNHSLEKIDLRKGIRKEYGIECINYPDSKIGEYLTLKLYCDATNKKQEEVRKLRTHRSIFKFKDCIPEYVKFTTPEFIQTLEYLQGIEVTELKDSFSHCIESKDVKIDLGTGGLHFSNKSGIYDADDEYWIIDCDVEGMYPSIAIVNDYYPEHLGKEFTEVYKSGIVDPRKQAKRSGNMVKSNGLKLSSNAVYGKSNSIYSFLYDSRYTLNTTLTGQLVLCMLSERLINEIPNLTMLQINTDGLTVKMPKKYAKKYVKICEEWEAITKLKLEYVRYNKMVIANVNNYIAVSKDGKVKRKGLFKLNSEMRKDGEWHKSFSQGVVKIALSEYFLNNVPVEKTIHECQDVFEFTKMANSTGKWWTETFEQSQEGLSPSEIDDVVDKLQWYAPPNGEQEAELREKNWVKRNDYNVTPQQKNNRYLLTNNGVRFRKCVYKPDKETGQDVMSCTEYEADKLVTILNEYKGQTVADLDINYQYYIDECYKVIHLIDGTTEREELERKRLRDIATRERETDNFIRFCVNKTPTQKQWDSYKRDYLIDKFIQEKKYHSFLSYLPDEIRNQLQPENWGFKF